MTYELTCWPDSAADPLAGANLREPGLGTSPHWDQGVPQRAAVGAQSKVKIASSHL